MKKTADDATQLKGKKGLKRLANATRYSMQGFAAAWKKEAAFREEVLLCAVLLPLAVCLPVSAFEKLVVVQATLFVPLVEILNSAVEAAVDRFGPEIHPLAGYAKDLGSAAVFMALCMAALAWIVVAGPVAFSLFV